VKGLTSDQSNNIHQTMRDDADSQAKTEQDRLRAIGGCNQAENSTRIRARIIGLVPPPGQLADILTTPGVIAGFGV
jgi:hypothetical protein